MIRAVSTPEQRCGTEAARIERAAAPSIDVPCGLGRWIAGLLVLATGLLAGCDESRNTMGRLDLVWGRRGISDGRFIKPRAAAIDARQRIYVVDRTARIQMFDLDGRFLRGWRTPDSALGRPEGLSVGRDGRILVADGHYQQVLIYSPEGELLERFGGQRGYEPGQFSLITDAVEDSQGNLYVADYGEYDRIQKFDPHGRFLLQWGGHGSQPGQFRRPHNLALDRHGNIWVADACNHRIQAFDSRGRLITVWGTRGTGPGQLYYPYDLTFAPDGTLFVVEYGNHRIQRFTPDGHSLGCWGRHGREEGELCNPWAVVCDNEGRIYVVDTDNDRIQRVKL